MFINKYDIQISIIQEDSQLFCSFKNSFEQEKYLEIIKINKYRTALNKFRL